MGVKVREKPKGSGQWWIFVDHQGRRKAKKVGTNKKVAMEIAKKLEARLVLGEYQIADSTDEVPNVPLFQTYSMDWLERYVKPLRRESTYQRYNVALRKHVYPTLGQRPISEITRGEVRNLLLKCKEKGLSWGSVCIVRDVISGPLGYAVDEELIPSNPVTGITKRLSLNKVQQDPLDPLNREEAELFLAVCQDHSPEYHAFFLCALRTGMRLGELLGLQWGDIDWHGKFIRVSRSYKVGRINATKNGRIRRVDASDQLLEALGVLHRERKREALRAGRGEPVEFVFHRDGKPIEQNYIRRVFKRTLRKSGLREIRLHDLRHTYASLLLSDGQSPVYVKEQLGHSSIQITVDVYGHLIPSSNREAVNRLDTQPDATYTQPAKAKRL